MGRAAVPGDLARDSAPIVSKSGGPKGNAARISGRSGRRIDSTLQELKNIINRK
jgi:hypothetical protein